MQELKENLEKVENFKEAQALLKGAEKNIKDEQLLKELSQEALKKAKTLANFKFLLTLNSKKNKR